MSELFPRKNYGPIEARGDEGSNREVIGVTAVLDPSDSYPESGRIIMGSLRSGESVPFAVCMTPDNARKLGEILIQAANESDAATKTPAACTCIAICLTWRVPASTIPDGMHAQGCPVTKVKPELTWVPDPR